MTVQAEQEMFSATRMYFRLGSIAVTRSLPVSTIISQQNIHIQRCNSAVHIPHLMTYTLVGDSNGLLSTTTIQQI